MAQLISFPSLLYLRSSQRREDSLSSPQGELVPRVRFRHKHHRDASDERVRPPRRSSVQSDNSLSIVTFVFLSAFQSFLRREHSEENIMFWRQCQFYKSMAGDRRRMAYVIYNEYIDESAPSQVNIDAETRSDIGRLMAVYDRQPPADLFAAAQKHVYDLMKRDPYPRFLVSRYFLEGADISRRLEENRPEMAVDSPRRHWWLFGLRRHRKAKQQSELCTTMTTDRSHEMFSSSASSTSSGSSTLSSC